MKSAFFCATPYQVFIAIHMKNTTLKNKTVDIFVLDHFKGAKGIVERLTKRKIFDNIQLVSSIEFKRSYTKENKVTRHLKMMKYFLGYEKIIEKYIQFNDLNYSEIFFTTPELIIQLAVKYIYKKNNKIIINFFEDGTGGYTPVMTRTSATKKIFNLITGVNNIVDHYDNLHLFRPELFTGKNEKKVSFKKIPPISYDEKNIKMANLLFDYNSENIIDEPIIFFEQPLNHIEGLDNRIFEIISEVNREDMIIKIHPRSNSAKYQKFKKYPTDGIPWEIIALNSDIEDKILISYYSTALISNKVIFDKEPHLIFLYEMKELKEYSWLAPEPLELVEKVKKIYRAPSRVHIPKDISELNEVIQKIK